MIELRFCRASRHACSGELLHGWTVSDLDSKASTTTDAPMRVGSFDTRDLRAAARGRRNSLPRGAGLPVALPAARIMTMWSP